MNQPIAFSDRMLESLNATRPWVKFLAILGFIFIALMVLMGLAMITGMFTGFATPGMPQMPVVFDTVFGIFYLVLAFVYVMPPLYLYRYAKAIAGIQNAATMAGFEDALKQQKSFWKFIGILMIIILVLEVLFMVGAVIVGIYLAAHHH